MNVKKIKDLKRKGNRTPKTKKQIEASRRNGLKLMMTKNPMHNPESVEKLRRKKKGIITSPKTLFKKGNTYGSKNRGMKHSEGSKIKISMAKIGRCTQSEKYKNKLSKRMQEHNPMHNPESVRKNCESRKKSYERRREEKRDIANKKRRLHLEKYNFKKGNIPWNQRFHINEKTEIKRLYFSGLSVINISKKFNCHKTSIYNILKNERGKTK